MHEKREEEEENRRSNNSLFIHALIARSSVRYDIPFLLVDSLIIIKKTKSILSNIQSVKIQTDGFCFLFFSFDVW